MESWIADTLKIVAPAVIAGIGGWWAHWKLNREKEKEAELREQERQAEYDEFKRKRKLIGAGEVEKMERADKLSDLMIKFKEHEITFEEFREFRDDLIAGRKPRREKNPTVSRNRVIETYVSDSITLGDNVDAEVRTKDSESLAHGRLSAEAFVQMADFDQRLSEEHKLMLAARLLEVLSEKGPNGFPVGYDKDGSKVEWLASDSVDIANGAEAIWAMPLLRNEEEIHAASEEYFEKVWWSRHQILKGREAKEHADDPNWVAIGSDAAKAIEAKYGIENLGWDDFLWGMINGKLSALRWVTGSEWDFLDT